MKVRFWGVRGSIPSPGQHTIRYGGNTTCIEVRGDDGALIILDAGTGIFPLAQELLKQLPVQANIFITHTHWDHIQGLPFFTPLYIPGNSVRIHGGFDIVSGRGIDQVMEVQLQYSYFPVREAEMRAGIEYETLNIGEPVSVGDATVTPLMLNHPVVNFGYRVDCNGKSVFFTGDHEPWPNIYAPEDDEYAEFQQMVEMQQGQLDRALAGLDVLIADSSYTAAEYPAKVGWGHGTLEGNIAWARRLGVKKLICTHHEPTRSDADLERAFAAALESAGHVPGGAGEPEIVLSREGLELVL
ncbi:MBL fold metallo-hydrolase [Sulfuritalea hydrogenivorans]|jgi:phosphoribosyl 1,2-cyclic phosphodiesterase|uniref:Beta-lactamase-like protein n=1 Tax=Sulfuritalea hydrogenivorans sk43H TaxID=1223802 RepID=W0SDW2_9PROT|nr:MBL fold metallo-hydrolase [Sulfuritalea hydrogenivorans]BAO29251.1 beta-lactamase-like protein [Sulfuritalea hydrogenivorans sk43H]